MKKSNHVNPIWRSIAILLAALVVAQFFLFISVLESKHPKPTYSPNNAPVIGLEMRDDVTISATVTSRQVIDKEEALATTSKVDSHSPEGVAATIMLKAPKWFHRRYTAMLHNALANIPPTWSVQVFSNEDWLEKSVLPLHPGLQRMRSHPRIIWTPMPKELTKKKPKEIMKSTWLWQSVTAENVLLFSGNGVFCANSKRTIEDFLDSDYVGVPWGKFNGVGGDGSSHSFRKRSDMIRILKKYPPESEMDAVDYHYFPKYLVKEGTSKMADVNTTILFGGTTDPDSAPFAVSGTQAKLDFNSRESLLHVCPELNIIFPSLHEPSCFGAHPKGEQCKASICALRDNIPPQGC